MSDKNWWDAYSYEEDTLQYVIPNYKIERFKTWARDLNEQLAEKDKQLELSQKREAILLEVVNWYAVSDDVGSYARKKLKEAKEIV